MAEDSIRGDDSTRSAMTAPFPVQDRLRFAQFVLERLPNGRCRAKVELTWRVLSLGLNGAGNFFSEMAVAKPYHAKIVTGASVRAMTAEQTSGDCNACHTPAGANGAPGRIVLP